MDILNNIIDNAPSTFWKKGRLETFKNWPYQAADNCNPEKMAAAGFYFIGSEQEPDLVACFICSKELDGWDQNDDPWSEHKKHQPSCAFVKLHKQEEMSWTINDLYSLLTESVKKSLEKETDIKVNKINEHMTDLAHEIPNIYKGLKKSRKNV